MGAADPTYPLYPVLSIIAAAMTLSVLLTSFVRQNWNLGVAFLCFWLFVENLLQGIDAIVWSDNFDVRLYVYCDIVSRLQVITFVVKPMATFIITRRLYLIASLRSVELPSKAARRKNLLIEWVLGLVIPLLIAGPIYYVNQGARFIVHEGVGCTNIPIESILEILVQGSWTVIPPVLSITIYYPRVAWIFYQQHRDVNGFLRSNHSVSRTNYLRILALASLDILLTLPMGIVSIILNVTSGLAAGGLPFYPGWTVIHSYWEPMGFPYTDLRDAGTSALAEYYFTAWSSPVLAFVIFGLFGMTVEARASYRRVVCTVGGWLGWKPTSEASNAWQAKSATMAFRARPQEISLDAEMGSNPSFVNLAPPGIEPQDRQKLQEDKLAADPK